MVVSRRGRLGALALSVSSLFLAAGLPLLAQDEPTKSSASAAYRRVPPYFGQVGLTPDQRERIYSIRGEYQGQIAELKRQLAELQRQEIAECEAVLTDAQRKLLEQRRASRKAQAPAATPEPDARPAAEGAESKAG
jgi:hypothetical protein